VLYILILLLTNLRALRLLINAPLLERTIRRITSASSLLTVKSLPLRKLLLVTFYIANKNESGISLQEVIPYAALKSVYRIVLPPGYSSGYNFPG